MPTLEYLDKRNLIQLSKRVFEDLAQITIYKPYCSQF